MRSLYLNVVVQNTFALLSFKVEVGVMREVNVRGFVTNNLIFNC